MSERAAQVLRDALDLSIEERAKLASELLGSLEEPSASDAEKMWSEEIGQRARTVIEGSAKLLDYDKAMSELSKSDQ